MEPSRNGETSDQPASDIASQGLKPFEPSNDASSSSVKLQPASIASDEHSFTSFPSLSPSQENSPQATRDGAAAQSTTPRPNRIPSPSEPPPFDHERLFTPTPSARERAALFEDTPKHTREIPGALHLQDEENVEHLVSRTGAVALVKQMAEDLAQRDAQVTLLQRRAEEREALLRRMLRECEVSNLDIENRLRELERLQHASADDSSAQSSVLGMQPNASMADRMTLALSDRQEVARRSEAITPTSISSQASIGRKTGASKGWKGYLFSGSGSHRQTSAGGSQASKGQRNLSSNSAARPLLTPKQSNSGVFSAASPTLSRKSSVATSLGDDDDLERARQPSIAESDSAASSRSVAAWALRLVAGNQQGSRSNLADQTNSKAATAADTDERKAASSRNSVTGNNVKNSTIRRRNDTLSTTSQSKHRPTSISSGRSRAAPGDSSRATAKDIITANSPTESADGEGTNLGPVEMDTIIPEGTGPPTLSSNTFNSSGDEYLTDSFGFIYDQRRRRRQNEAAAALPRDKNGSVVESLQHHRSLGSHDFDDGDAASIDNRLSLAKTASRPETSGSATSKDQPEAPKRWQDYLKLATFSTELLSHTPSVGPITNVTISDDAEDKQSQIQMSKQGSMPALGQVPTPSATRVVSGNAEFATPTSSNPTSPSAESETDADPVKALVEHLTEVHEAAQREKAIKWNDFLRKVRVDRRRDLNSKVASENRGKRSTMPENFLADGEMIGIAGLGVRGKVGRAKGNEFRSLILGGIPTSYRSKIWTEASGAASLRVPGYYEELTESEFTDMAIVQQIQMDITRTLTDNVYYRRGAGVDKLKEVLLAYARRNPDIGYCQGMNLITANLLLIMPTAEDAFWVLTSMIENILPERYYDSSLLTSRADQVVLRQYVAEILPQLSTHLENLGIELEALTFQWFLSVFTDCLSAEALFRVWDVILCISEGATFLFQVALALLKLNEKSLLKCESPAEVYGYINQGMTEHAISIDNLIRASDALKKEVRSEEVLKRRSDAVERELETSRQRDAIRKGKSKAKVSTPPPKSPIEPVTVTKREPGRITAADDITKGRAGKLMRQDSRGDFDEEARQALGELEVRTPMPIDEEAMWRG